MKSLDLVWKKRRGGAMEDEWREEREKLWERKKESVCVREKEGERERGGGKRREKERRERERERERNGD